MHAKRLKKLIKAIELFGRPNGATIKEAMEGLEAEDRGSVYRIIRTMESLGFPLYSEKIESEREHRWKFEERFQLKLSNISLPKIDLSLSEAIALFFMRGEASVFEGTDIEKQLETVFSRLKTFMPISLDEKIPRIQALLFETGSLSKDYADKEDIIEDLIDAILDRQTCYIKYDSFTRNEITQFAIDPLVFFKHHGGLYLFARATSFDETRVLAVERIKEITLTEKRFSDPEEFDARKVLENCFGVVNDEPVEAKIWFSSSQAKYVAERRFGGNYEFQWQEDGSMVLHIKTSGVFELKKWILSWGADALVIEPDWLKQDIIEEFQSALKNYETGISISRNSNE